MPTSGHSETIPPHEQVPESLVEVRRAARSQSLKSFCEYKTLRYAVL